MDNAKTIDIAEIRRISDLIFDHVLNNLEVKSVELTEDMYWTITPNDIYDIGNDPKDFGIGQLYDDLDFLRRILDDESQAVPAMMMHLAPILGYLATRVNWYDQTGN